MDTPPIIAPLPYTASRPLFSVMIPAHNRLRLLAETLQSVLHENIPRSQMQIEVVDDASTGGEIIQLVGQLGDERVDCYRQPANVGSLQNFATCLNRAKGQLVHLLHSDDLVKPGYYAKMKSLFERYPDAGAFFCRFQYIDAQGRFLFNSDAEMSDDGILDNWLERLAVKQRIQYCAIVVKREVYEELGGFYGTTYGEDWEMWLRIARYYPVAYSPQILAAYRMHDHSISGNSYEDARNLRDIQWVININKTHLPREKREKLAKKAMKFYAHYGLQVANQIWHQTHDKRSVKAQMQEALKMHRDIGIYFKIGKIYTKMLLNIS